MASWFQSLKNSFRSLTAYAESRLHGGAIVETLGTIRGDVRGLGLECQPTGKIAVHRVRAEEGTARVALAFEQNVLFGKGDGAVVVSLAKPDVRALIGMLRRACPDDGAEPSVASDRPRTTG